MKFNWKKKLKSRKLRYQHQKQLLFHRVPSSMMPYDVAGREHEISRKVNNPNDSLNKSKIGLKKADDDQ